MPFKFKIKNANTSYYMEPQLSELHNDFINFSIRGAQDSTLNDIIWVTAGDPIPLSATTVIPMRFYNPGKNIFLGDSEQFQIGTGYTGDVAGSPNFTTTSLAKKWYLKTIYTGQYRIFCLDSANTTATTTNRRLIMDTNNQNRVILSASSVSPTSSLSDLWTIESA